MNAGTPAVLVTGAARRIGRAIALEAARGGHDVAVHCHTSKQDAETTADAVRALGVRAEVFAADLADEAACRALVPRVIERLGRLDAIVNSAAVFDYDDAAGFGHASMERHWRANTAPAVLLAQALHARLSGSGRRGVVINLLDQKLHNPNPDYFSYTLSKAALDAATTMLAIAFAPEVRVIAVAPGVTLPSAAIGGARFERAHRATPLGRSSTPEDIARAVCFLLGAEAITGITLLVDGGQHLAPQRRDVQFLLEE